MNFINYFGFSVDPKTQRVCLKEGKFAYFSQSIPTAEDTMSVGTSRGVIISSNAKVGMNGENNFVYRDLKGKKYEGTTTTKEQLTHDEQGRLLVDSIGAIVRTYKGLGFTQYDAVAINPTDVVPDAPKLNNVFPANTSIVLDFDESGSEPQFYTGYAFDGTQVYKAEVFDPDEDLAILGLTTGEEYECWVTATSANGMESAKSNTLKATCKSIIPAPVFKSCVAGDGKATVTYTPITLPDNYTTDHYAYSAINMDDKTAPAVEGHIENNVILLPNDITWYVRICAVCNPGRVPGDFSDALTVTPSKQEVPYRPIITNCYVQPSGQIVATWVKGTSFDADQSGAVVDKWKVNVIRLDDAKQNFAIEIPDPATTKVTTDKVAIGQWGITIQGHNSFGWSEESKMSTINYIPTVETPILGGLRYEDTLYRYACFYSETTTTYEAPRTDAGINTEFEVLMVGAGGAGKSQTVTFAKGGDGGGGELVFGKLPATNNKSSIFITVPNGGAKGTDSPAAVTVVETTTTLTANSGKTATDKNDAAGYPRTKVPDGWNSIQPFTWLMPDSQYVGGVVTAGQQNFPNATFGGQGGAGTKDSLGGKGNGGTVIIRWKK